MKKVLVFAALVTAVLLFTTCEEPIDFVEAVGTEVKVANDLFLVVESVSPADNSTGINPGSEIYINFDRDISLGSVTSETIEITDLTNSSSVSIINPEFNSSIKRLKIEPGPDTYFENSHDYSIEISGIQGSDGSEMQEAYIWNFKTGTAPAGSIQVIDRSTSGGAADSGYTNESYVDVSVAFYNDYADYFYITDDYTSIDDDGEIEALSAGVWHTVGTPFSDFNFSTSVDGVKTVYAVFKGELPDFSTGYSKIEEKTITLDTVSPELEAGETRYKNSSQYIVPTSYSGAAYYEWSSSDPELSFSPSDSYYSYISSTTEGTYTVDVELRDRAGNSTSDSFTFVWDTTAPTVTLQQAYSTINYTSVPFNFTVTDNLTPVTSLTYNVYDSDNGWYYGSSSVDRLAVSGSPVTHTVDFFSHNYSYEYARAYVFDLAGNYAYKTDYLYIDDTPPSAPSVSGTTPTTDITPTWTWSSGGNGGVGYYQYNYNDTGWSSETTALSYTALTITNGYNFLRVRERDARNNWSDYTTQIIKFDVMPVPNAKFVSTRPTFDWNTPTGAPKGTTYTLQVLSGHTWLDVKTGLTTSGYTFIASDPALQTDTQYTWRYVATGLLFTYTSPACSFTTGLGK